MAKLHIGIAIFFFAAFLATGAYMLFNFPELYAGREDARMMYRATHIYILLASLLNLMMGNLMLAFEFKRFNVLKNLMSLVLIASPGLFLVAFFIEPASINMERPITFNTMCL